jgi:hypothetical protein
MTERGRLLQELSLRRPTATPTASKIAIAEARISLGVQGTTESLGKIWECGWSQEDQDQERDNGDLTQPQVEHITMLTPAGADCQAKRGRRTARGAHARVRLSLVALPM